MFDPGLPSLYTSSTPFLTSLGQLWGRLFFFSREKIEKFWHESCGRGRPPKHGSISSHKTSHTITDIKFVHLADVLFSPKSTVDKELHSLFGRKVCLLYPLCDDVYYFLTEEGSSMIVSSGKSKGKA